MPEIIHNPILRKQKPAKAEAPKRRRTQQERRAESTTRMLDAAAELFAIQGYERTTFLQIGELAGYSSGLIAHRFGSQSELVRSLIREIRNRTQVFVAEIALQSATPLERLDSAIRAYSNAVVHGGARLRALFVLMAESVGPLAEERPLFAGLNRAFIGLIERLIVEGRECGDIRSDADPHNLAVEIVASLRGLTLLWLIDPVEIDFPKLCDLRRTEFIAKLKSNLSKTTRTRHEVKS